MNFHSKFSIKQVDRRVDPIVDLKRRQWEWQWGEGDGTIRKLHFPEAERCSSEAAAFQRGACDLDPGPHPEGAAGPQSTAPGGQARGGEHGDR